MRDLNHSRATDSSGALSALRPEGEIIASWEGFEHGPIVSILCHTFNHEQYVRDALNGFLAQETDFPFEIIVHDDASNDETAHIIADYVVRYPQLIVPVYQPENRYGRGGRPLGETWGRARGEYVALCEGDDFWTDPWKLQCQVAALRDRPGCDMAFHPALVRYEDASRSDAYQTYLKDGDKLISAYEIIRRGGGFCPTTSLVYRREVFDRLPQWFFNEAPVGDQFHQIIGSLRGGAFYIDRPMAVYRRNSHGSWSSRMSGLDYELGHNRRRIACLIKLNEELGYRYDSAFRFQAAKWMVRCAYRYQKAGHVKEFRECIVESWQEYPGATWVQRALYMSRGFSLGLSMLNILDDSYAALQRFVASIRSSVAR